MFKLIFALLLLLPMMSKSAPIPVSTHAIISTVSNDTVRSRTYENVTLAIIHGDEYVADSTFIRGNNIIFYGHKN
jgi:hypothetical protein